MTPTKRAFDKRLTVAALAHRARWFHDGVMTVYDGVMTMTGRK